MSRIGAKYPVIQTAEPLGVLTLEREDPVLHSVTPDGRPMHSMTKVDGVWCCPCGERRDRFGKPLPQESL